MSALDTIGSYGIEPEFDHAKMSDKGQPVNGHLPSKEWIRETLGEANLNALRLALYQATGDEDLTKVEVVDVPIRGGAMFAYGISDADKEIVKDKAVEYLYARAGDKSIPPPPSKEDSRKLMDIFGKEPIKPEEFNYNYEELAFDEFPRLAEWTKGQPSPEKLKEWKILIVGAGIGGIACAVQLKKLGIPFKIVERQGSIGGTWLRNTYMGARVDTTSYLFQYKFVKNYPWTEFFASAGETQKYLAYVVKLYGLEEYFEFNKEVVQSTWIESESKWEVTTRSKDGTQEKQKANIVFSAAGLFNAAHLPDIPGIKDFKNPMFHTTEWRHDIDLTGKRVAVIGNGSTGVQLAPLVAEIAGTLTHYQRTPNWLMSLDGYRRKVDQRATYLFENIPYYWNWYCYGVHIAAQQLQWLQLKDPKWQAAGGQINERNDKLRENMKNYVKEKTKGKPELYEKLIPEYPPVMRRLVVDNGFYDMLMQPNAELVTDGIDTFTATGIRSKDGTEREHDVVVLAAGFRTEEYFHPVNYVGRNGRKFADDWNKDGARSYLGLHNPDFPNFFSFWGPNHGPRSGGYYSWAEVWARYAITAVIHLIEEDKKSIDVRRDLYDEYQKKLDARVPELIWEGKGANYYVNKHGRSQANMPWTCAEYHQMVLKPNWSDFKFT